MRSCLNLGSFELYEKFYDSWQFETNCNLENIVWVVTLWNGKKMNVATVMNNN